MLFQVLREKERERKKRKERVVDRREKGDGSAMNEGAVGGWFSSETKTVQAANSGSRL